MRDALLGKPPSDLDFAVLQRPDRSERSGRSHAVIALGRDVADALGGAFYVMDDLRGTSRVILPSGLEMDFAVCRGGSWEDDLRARDFSINAIALDIFSGELIDPLNGASDLRQRIVRMASQTAISDDPVRILRATRMAMSLGAQIEPSTRKALMDNTPRLAAADAPSAERMRDEVLAILARPNAADGIRLAEELGWLKYVIAEASPVSAETLAVAERVANTPPLVGKKADTRLVQLAVLLRHVSPDRALARCRALKLSKQEMDAVRCAITQNNVWQRRAEGAPTLREMYRLALGAGEFAPEVAALAQAINPRLNEFAAQFLRTYFERFAPNVAPAPLVTGEDALALGMRAGPRVGAALAHVREAQMVGKISTREEALGMLNTES